MTTNQDAIVDLLRSVLLIIQDEQVEHASRNEGAGNVVLSRIYHRTNDALRLAIIEQGRNQ